MKTFLYNLNTQKREGPIREGRYLVDGVPGPLPDYLVELEIENRPTPPYNNTTQTIEYRSFADLSNLKWVEESYVRDLREEEIINKLPDIPLTCTLRQFKLALIYDNIPLLYVEDYIANIADSREREIAQTEWNHALTVQINSPIINTLTVGLGLTSEQIRGLFIIAKTIL